MTAVTISSFIPSVSIFGAMPVSPGDGGGVYSDTRPRLFGRSSALRAGEVTEASVGDGGDWESIVCERFTRFEGGDCVSVACLDGGER
jgi:hypothetical protein